MINLDTVKATTLPVPSLSDQEWISKEMCGFETTYAAIREAVERQAVLLAVRRHALTAAAVTGQIDVSTARGVDV